MKLIINIDILILLLNIIVLLTGCFCIGPGIDSRLAVLAPRANTADRDSQFVTLLLNNLTGPYDRAV